MFLHAHILSFWKVSVRIPVLKMMPTPRRQLLPRRTDTRINSPVSIHIIVIIDSLHMYVHTHVHMHGCV